MRIVMDVDSVLCDFVGGGLEVINALSGTAFTHQDVVSWDLEDLLPEELRPAFAWHVDQKGYCARLKPLPGAIPIVNELRRRGHKVVIATSPWRTSEHWICERQLWIQKWFGTLECYHFHDKSGIAGDIFVDDKPKHVREWAERNGSEGAFLFNAPHNQGESESFRRLYSLRQLLDFAIMPGAVGISE